ncbi:hypothetical protein Tsp_06463 [Trichinella spiralis]|uniref:hypothetical protein n=1 Tax=Trichinella spiralis TaxID=6334 RepID=UPI0001EFC6D2|nr:hypothetical protein Tsp_06463 [Trichinella spiralis]
MCKLFRSVLAVRNRWSLLTCTICRSVQIAGYDTIIQPAHQQCVLAQLLLTSMVTSGLAIDHRSRRLLLARAECKPHPYQSVHHFITRCRFGTFTFSPSCSFKFDQFAISLLQRQLRILSSRRQNEAGIVCGDHACSDSFARQFKQGGRGNAWRLSWQNDRLIPNGRTITGRQPFQRRSLANDGTKFRRMAQKRHAT